MGISPALKQLMAQKANKYKTSGGNARKLKEGRTVLRVIAPKPGQVPWVKEEMEIFRDLGVHWIKPNENAKPMAVVGSSEICYGTVSPLSAAVDMAIASAYDEDTKKLFESWKARTSVLFNAVDRADGVDDLWEVPKGVWGKIMDLWNLYAEQDFDIFDHDTGVDLVITRTGTGLNTKYDVQVMPMMPGKTFAPVPADVVARAKDPNEYIQTNFFRGEEPKALSAIAQLSGVVVPQLGAPTTPTAALSSPAATVADAPVNPATPSIDPAALAAAQAAQAAQKAAQQAQADQAAQTAAADAQRQREALMAQLAALNAASAPVTPTTPVVVTPTEVTPPAATVGATTQMSDLPVSEQDDLLRQLAMIGN